MYFEDPTCLNPYLADLNPCPLAPCAQTQKYGVGVLALVCTIWYSVLGFHKAKRTPSSACSMRAVVDEVPVPVFSSIYQRAMSECEETTRNSVSYTQAQSYAAPAAISYVPMLGTVHVGRAPGAIPTGRAKGLRVHVASCFPNCLLRDEFPGPTHRFPCAVNLRPCGRIQPLSQSVEMHVGNIVEKV
jgi:hypothetical protein